MSAGKPRTAITPDSGFTITLRFASMPTTATSASRSSPQKSLSVSVAMRLLCTAAPVAWPGVVVVDVGVEVVELAFGCEEIEPDVTRMSVVPLRLPAR